MTQHHVKTDGFWVKEGKTRKMSLLHQAVCCDFSNGVNPHPSCAETAVSSVGNNGQNITFNGNESKPIDDKRRPDQTHGLRFLLNSSPVPIEQR